MFNIIREYIRQSKSIKDDEEFNNLYKKLNGLKEIEVIEEKRSMLILKIIKLYSITILVTVLLIFVRQKIYISPIVNLILIVVVAIIVFKTISELVENKEEYLLAYKNKVLIKVLKTLNPNTEYCSKNGIGLNFYKEAEFEDGVYNQYESSDYIRIYRKNTYIDMANVKLNKVDIINNEVKTNNIFNGICCYTPINKNIEKVYVKKSIQNIIIKDRQIILDNEQFEKNFNTFSENRMLTMQILTPQVMENMLKFVQNSAINFEVVIKKQRIYFKFYSGPISKPLYFSFSDRNRREINKKYIYYYYCVFKFIIEMTEYLSNTINELDI